MLPIKVITKSALLCFFLDIIILHNGQLLEPMHIPNDNEINHQKHMLKRVKVSVCLGSTFAALSGAGSFPKQRLVIEPSVCFAVVFISYPGFPFV